MPAKKRVVKKAARKAAPPAPKLDGVFDRLRKVLEPYARHMVVKHDGPGIYYLETAPVPKYGTEDMLFCYRLKRKGVRIWCDTDATSGHVGFAPVITEALHVRASEMLEAEKNGHAKQVAEVTGLASQKGQIAILDGETPESGPYR